MKKLWVFIASAALLTGCGQGSNTGGTDTGNTGGGSQGARARNQAPGPGRVPARKATRAEVKALKAEAATRPAGAVPSSGA